MDDFNPRLEMISARAWKIWTNNGQDLDDDMRYQTRRTADDIANNAYGSDDMTDQEWLDATLQALKADK